jgi:hypothetical protein
MRTYRNARILLSLTIASALAVWAACGNDSSAITDTTPASGAGTDVDSGGSTPTGDASPTDSGKDAGSTFVEPGDIVIDGGPGLDGGLLCFDGGEAEEEPNDSPLLANILRAARCGIVKVPAGLLDAGLDGGVFDGGERDYLKFSWDAEAPTTFRLFYRGDVHVIVETDGMAPVDISEANQAVQLFRGQNYNVEIKSRQPSDQQWRVQLSPE